MNKRVIKLLNECGFKHDVEQSGATYVRIYVAPHHLIDEADRMITILKNHGIDFKVSRRPEVECVYDPISGFASIQIERIDDLMLDQI